MSPPGLHDSIGTAPRIRVTPEWAHESGSNGDVIVLRGDWIAGSGNIPRFPDDLMSAGDGALGFDTSGLGSWDTGLIEFLWDAKCTAAAAKLNFDDDGLPGSARKLLSLLPDTRDEVTRPKQSRLGPLTWIGGKTLDLLIDVGDVSALLAATVKQAVLTTITRVYIRAVDLRTNLYDAGPSALLIVGVVNFLIGAILAFVGAVQLRRFAADVFVADLVGLAVVREMAPVMTAIIMSGRTGGAYAARIATMRGNEELDALEVVGIPVLDYIVLPSVVALGVTMPLLYLYGSLLGMFGGLLVAIAMLSMTPLRFIHELLGAVPLDQFVFGGVKSVAFGLMIGLTSCRIGLLAGYSAADVGIAATRAVVVGIVGVIAMDAIFAVIADVIGV
jgi:phospholipid/cholesterol/gamma-HCH transport system permease protein